jgi:AcrR family transcriptional regulator
MSDVTAPVPPELVRAAIRAAEDRGSDVADVPVTELAAAAGISRSTLLRRVGGSRRALDEAVRATGVDPGGRRPVRERAIDAAAALISSGGLGAATLEAVAAAAACSAHSLYVTFGGRDGLLAAVYERYSPLLDYQAITAAARGGDLAGDLSGTVRAVYRAIAASFGREPKVAPAMLADMFSRPDGPARRLFDRYFPAVLEALGGWLAAEVRAGRIRPMPVPLLLQQLIGPVIVHLMLRPALTPGYDQPTVEQACELFGNAFVRAVSPEISIREGAHA